MRRPDFACGDLGGMGEKDLRFLLENMPAARADYRELAALLKAFPSTLESMLTSDYVFGLIHDSGRLVLDISPFLLFGVLLRRSLGRPRTPLDRRVINYIANLLALFVHAGRLYRIEPGDPRTVHYVVEQLQGIEQADARRQFVTYAHVGNFALWLTGLRSAWLEERFQHGRRPVGPRYYEACGRAYFERAARHRLAREFDLDDIFLRLAVAFDHYREGLDHMGRHYMPGGFERQA